MSDINFEKTIKELDEIVAKLEKGDLPLDDMLKYFERGIELSRVCNKLLDDAENKVNILIKKEDGKCEKQPFTSTEGM